MLPLLAFLVSFAATYPGAIVNADEAKYIRQAAAFAQGETQVEQIDPYTGQVSRVRPSDYPPGTSLLLTPLVAADWRLAMWLPALALIGAVLFTALALRAAHWPPWFALLLAGFVPALVMARVATSDMVSALFVALGWWLFWRGASETAAERRRWILWLAAGLVAGLSLLLRETNALLFVPLLIGALLRRDKHWWCLAVGGAVGVSVRLLAAGLVFGDPQFIKDAGYGFSVSALIANAPVYLAALLVLAPGGLVFGLAYRGLRAPEVVLTLLLVTLFYLAYEYSGQTSGWLKQFVLGPRFFIPLLPVLAFAMGESAPRLLRKLKGQRHVLPAAGVATAVLAVGVNVAFGHWSARQAEIQQAILTHVPQGEPVLTNASATEKFVTELQGYPVRGEVSAGVQPPPDAWIVILQRADSPYWAAEGEKMETYLAGVRGEVVLDKEFTGTDRLRILRVAGAE